MSHNFQICPIDFALHGDNVPYDIFAFKITASYNTTHKDFHQVKMNTIIGVYVGHSPNHHGEISRGGGGGGGGGGTPTNCHTGVCRSIGSILKGQFP